MCIILCKCRSTFDATFGWTSRLSLLNTMQLPSVDPVVVTAIVGSVALLLVQPICVSRMYCRRRSTSTTCHSSPRPSDRRHLRVVRYRWQLLGCRVDGLPAGTLSDPDRILPPQYLTIRASAHECSHAALAVRGHLRAARRLLPAVSVRVVVRLRDQLLHSAALPEQRYLLAIGWAIVGLLVYSELPLVLLFRLIKDEHANRTFRLFRSQFVETFVDRAGYIKLLLLVVNLLFSIIIVLVGLVSGGDGDDFTGQFIGGLVLATAFLSFYVYS